MASSNRHWPSMFKSKPSNSHNQGQHEINSTFVSSGCHRPSPYASAPGSEERSPEPKPRWNPKPEQIRILEAIFNSGMVNPPRDEIRKIRAQLQEYGQVGDANVFYWFQNRKSRSKHKLRHLQKSQVQTQHTTLSKSSQANTSSNSSSSSEKSSPKGSNKGFPISSSSILMDPSNSNSPTGSVNQTFFHTQNQGEFLQEPFFFPVQQTTAGTINFSSAQGFCFSDMSNLVHQVPEQQTVGPCTSLLLSEIMSHNGSSSMKVQEGKMIKNMQQQQSQFSSCYSAMITAPLSTHSTATTLPSPPTTFTIPSPINQVQGMVDLGGDQMGPAARSVVYINDVAIEVGTRPFNVREAFGDDVLLLHISGQPVVINEFGVTLQPLEHGASYHLISLKQCDWGASRENLDNLFV